MDSDEEVESKALVPVKEKQDRGQWELANRVYDNHQEDLDAIFGVATGLVRGTIEAAASMPEKVKGLYKRIRDRVPEEHYQNPEAWTAGPILSSLRHRKPGDELWEKYEALLTRACDRREKHDDIPRFTRLVDVLSPDVATLLQVVQRSDGTVTRTTDWQEEGGNQGDQQYMTTGPRKPTMDFVGASQELVAHALAEWQQIKIEKRDAGGERHYDCTRVEKLVVTIVGHHFYRACQMPPGSKS